MTTSGLANFKNLTSALAGIKESAILVGDALRHTEGDS